MSGHNKWSTIKHKKGRADAARGKLFTKLIRELTVATRAGGKDADANARLRSAVITARGANMPKDTIERAIRRGAGELEGETYDELTYEGYGPGGVAFIIETMTTNKNRTVAEVRHLLGKHGGNLGTDGSVSWMFEKKGVIEIPAEGVDFDELFEAAVEAGADDVDSDEETHIVTCEYVELLNVTKALEAAGYAIINAKPERIAKDPVPTTGKAAASAVKLMDALDDLDDVQNVFTNADISDEEMARIYG